MTTKYNYYLEDMERSDGHDSNIHKVLISCYDHKACIQVMGTDDQLTERVTKVLEGLNAE